MKIGQDFLYADHSPYPPIQVEEPNSRYAQAMLKNLGSCHSEISAVSLYLYNSLITQVDYPQISDCFRQVNMVEMRHLDIFGQLALLLGADPRLWSIVPSGSRRSLSHRRIYWSPSCNQYPRVLNALLENSLKGELDAIRQYEDQAGWIKDPNITAILHRIILDEICHVKIFRSLMDQAANLSGREK